MREISVQASKLQVAKNVFMSILWAAHVLTIDTPTGTVHTLEGVAALALLHQSSVRSILS
jgi:hypothetical protein